MIKTILVLTIGVILSGCLLAPIIEDVDGETTLEVYVLAGQSNAAYSLNSERCNPDYVDSHIPAPTTKTWYYGTESKPIRNGLSSSTPSDYDTTFESYSLWEMYRGGHWVIGGDEPALAYEIGERTNADVLIINAGVDNQKISELLPDTTCGQYVQEVISHALDHIDRTKYTEVNLNGVVWIQGESDNVANTSVESYKTDFGVLRNWYASIGFNQWYIVQIRGLIHDVVATAQSELADEYNNVKLTDVARGFTVANGLMTNDDIHYTQEGRDIVGKTVGEMTPENYHMRGGAYNLLKVIPLLVIVALLMAAVGAIAYSRAD